MTTDDFPVRVDQRGTVAIWTALESGRKKAGAKGRKIERRRG